MIAGSVRFPIATGLAVIVLALSCSSGELEKTRGDLNTCAARLNSLTKEVDSCRQESQLQTKRWESVQAALNESVPPTIEKVRTEVIQSIPQQVRVQVQLQLDRYFVSVAQGFKGLQDRNEEILGELRQARKEINETHGQVAKVASTASDLRNDLNSEQERVSAARSVQLQKQRELSEAVQKVIASVVEFDRTKVNCRDCREKIKLKDKSREEILKFHSNLVERLALLNVKDEE